MKLFLYTFILLVIILNSCGSSKITKSSKTPESNNIPDTDYYNQLSNNHERIFRLMTGKYSYYQDDTLELFSGKDSMVLYIVEVGTVGKDGYWIYSEQFITNLPNEPILQSLQKISRISRDTFQGLSYVLSDEGKAKYSGLSKDPTNPILKEAPLKGVAKEDQGAEECPMLYIKQSNTDYIMRSDICPSFANAGYRFMQIGGSVGLGGQIASMTAFDEKMDTVGVGEAFFKRVPLDKPKNKKE